MRQFMLILFLGFTPCGYGRCCCYFGDQYCFHLQCRSLMYIDFLCLLLSVLKTKGGYRLGTEDNQRAELTSVINHLISLCTATKDLALCFTISLSYTAGNRLSGLVVRVLGYRSGGPGWIPGTTIKKSSGSGTGSTQPREYNWGATWLKSSSSCLENREYSRRDPSCWPRGTVCPQKLAITSLTSGGRSVGIIRSRTQTMEFLFFLHSR
jgi:hypothetical protein